MTKRRSNSVLLTVGIGLMLAGGVAAQPSGPDQSALDTFKEAWDAGAAWTPPEGWVFRWRKEFLPALTLQEIESREAELRDLPDHPDHRYLRVQRRMLESGPQATEFEAWWSAPGSLRLNSTFGPSAALPYTDVVATPRNVYCLTSAGLAILDPHVPPPKFRTYVESSEGEILGALREFFVGGLGAFRYRELVPAEASLVGSNLVGVLASQDGALSAMQCTLHMDRAKGDGLPVVREVSLRTEEYGRSTEARVVYGDQVPSGVPGITVASRVEFLNANDQVVLRSTWLGARPMEEGEFARVTRLPSIDSVDATRGAVTFTSITDFRAGVIGRVDTATGGLVASRMPGTTGPPVTPEWLTVAGWTGAAILVASLVGVRLWRSRRASAFQGGFS